MSACISRLALRHQYSRSCPSPLGAESPPMLQYPVQLPPLSLSSSKHPKHNDLLNRNRPILSRQLSSPSPRSPYISSRHLPLPFRSSSSQSSILSQPLHDVLAPGDTVGEGSLLQGEPIQLVSSSHTELAREFEVIKQLGTGSYAVVYLVQEVLSRPVHSEDGHMSTIGLMELDTTNKPLQRTVYGREYAIKCLSKADLDQDALAVQMSEVIHRHFFNKFSCSSILVRFTSINPCIFTQTSLPSTIPLRRRLFFCFFLNTFQEKTSFSFLNNQGTIMISNTLTYQSLLPIRRQLPVYSPISILPYYFLALVSVSYHPCSLRCVMP